MSGRTHIFASRPSPIVRRRDYHRDSLGVSQKIRPGEVNWMTAGSGIVHSERIDPSLRSSGGLMHGSDHLHRRLHDELRSCEARESLL